MITDNDESMKFVLLIEEHQDVLIKSQKCAEKQKKVETVEKIIPKWMERSNKTLNQDSLFKKINNLKSRAKSARKNGKALSEWQKKILEIAGADEHQEKQSTSTVTLPDQVTYQGADENQENLNSTSTPSTVTDNDTFQGTEEHQKKLNSTSVVTLSDKGRESLSSNETRQPKFDAEQFLAKHEIEETRHLSNDQLQRFVLVKQAKVLIMQERRLERLERMEQTNFVESGRDVTFEYVGWEGANPANIA